MKFDLFGIFKDYGKSTIGLLLGYFLIIMLIIIKIDDFFEKYIENIIIRSIGYIILSLIWTVYWIFYQRFPKNKKEKIGLVFSIETENENQFIRIKKDLTNEIKNKLKENNLESYFNLIILENYHSKLLNLKINKYIESKKETLNKISIDFKLYKKVQIKLHNFLKKISGHFYIFGTIVERHDEKNKYIFNLNTLVLHKNIPQTISNRISKDINNILDKTITFLSNDEVKGFKITAENIYLTTRYIVGIAAFVSYDFELAFNLHKGLKDELSNSVYSTKNYKDVISNLNNFVSDELFILSRIEYFNKKNVNKTLEYIQKSLEINSSNYDSLMFKSYIYFVDYKDVKKAIKLLKSAEIFSNGNYTWLYNKAFIYMYIEKYDKGLKCYHEIEKINFLNDYNTIEQCIKYNEDVLNIEPTKYQCLFILGFLYYKKLNNYPKSFDNYDLFCKKVKGNPKYQILYYEAENTLKEIKKVIKIK